MEMLENFKAESTKKKIKRRIGKEEWIQRLLIIGMLLSFFIMLVLPLLQLFTQAFYDKDGAFVGVANFSKYLLVRHVGGELLARLDAPAQGAGHRVEGGGHLGHFVGAPRIFGQLRACVDVVAHALRGGG